MQYCREPAMHFDYRSAPAMSLVSRQYLGLRAVSFGLAAGPQAVLGLIVGPPSCQDYPASRDLRT